MTNSHQTHEQADDLPEPGDDDAGRRAMLRRAAIGGVGAAAAVFVTSNRVQAGDSGGTTIGGNAVELGSTPTNTTDTPTHVEYSGTDPLADASLFAVGQDRPSETDSNNVFPAAVGGYGKGNIASGVHGSTLNPAGFGVVAASLAPAPDDKADPVPVAPAGLAVAAASGPQVKFVPLDGAVVGPTPGTHEPGELYVDAEGTLWFTVPVAAVGTGDPGVRFVSLASSATAGAFHGLPIAKRIYDSREGATPTKLAEDETVDIDMTKDFEGNDSGFPEGAQLAQVNLTITGTEELGFVQLFATGTPLDEVKTSNINWFQTGATVANLTGVPVSPTGSITARVLSDTGDTLTASTHLIIDLVGFYR